MGESESLNLAVIIPMYNLEGYIEEAIESVLCQPHKKLHVICVDDGSTDKGADIVREIAERDSRVRLLQQANGGVSTARNCGIEYVIDNLSAEYIMFLDGDDVWCKNWLDTEAVSILNQKHDTVCFDACSVDHSLTYRAPYSHPFTGIVQGGDKAVDVNHTMWFATAFCVELLKKYNIRFHVGQKYGEDLCFLLEARSLSQNCCFVEKLIYLYRDRPGSAVRRHIPAIVYFPTLFDGWLRSYETLKNQGVISKAAMGKINWYIPDMIECHYRDGGTTAELCAMLKKYVDRLEYEGYCEEKVKNWKNNINFCFIAKQRFIGIAIRFSQWLRIVPAYRKMKVKKLYTIPLN